MDNIDAEEARAERYGGEKKKNMKTQNEQPTPAAACDE